jgi:hypothetical protein
LVARFTAAGFLDCGAGFGLAGVVADAGLWVGGRLRCGVEFGRRSGAVVGVLPAGGCAVGGVAAVDLDDQVCLCQLA